MKISIPNSKELVKKFHVRRTAGFALTVILVSWCFYQLAWQPDLRNQVFKHPAQSIGLLLVAIVAIGFMIWAIAKPSSWKVAIAFVLGLATAIWGSSLLHGVGWTQVGVLLATLVALVLLWAITTWGNRK